MVSAQTVALSGLQKAALVLIQIGKDRAARVMSEMTDDEVEALSAEIMRMSNVPREIAADVIDEFYENSIAASSLQLGHGGLDYAQKVLEQTFGVEKAEEIMERLVQGMQGQPFDFLKAADPREIVTLVSSEHPQTIALVLAHLRPDHAARVMAGLGPKLQGEVALRIAQMERANPEMVALVAASLQKKAAQVINSEEMQAVGGVEPLVDIINRADPGTEKMILTGLEERDEELADEVRSRMFVFEDIVMLEDRGIQLVLRQVDGAQLALALKGTQEDLRSRIMKNLSERARQNVMEEIDMLGAVRMSQVQEARAGIVQLIRKMEESGQIVIRREDEDEYVA
ncbi:MAG: flagellar motor switch protein FliG [Mobiluncus porci]|uniref:Flagellar motor switch protein FliG n=1 Tax=Mobiluncus porci TaxID=2652278 RepID=A0A7K0K3K2_9ACTO|nr:MULTISPECIES: flagellar motor switch protein FliG [Mobiluncus]MCI6584700.1 flagellar motor switch protein FliG [Mobiluncus sp.]MDD7540993.1 flagellar motor switch protein FliG [Mobiluncus porci]MDY5748168.1 flagellar motor switch protein FliG [Mobiluncus porci]MST49998.1 flagellar motor switch protein FliG [Mobiluncus porci]